MDSNIRIYNADARLKTFNRSCYCSPIIGDYPSYNKSIKVF